MLALRCQLQLRQLAGIVYINYPFDGPEGEPQIAITPAAGLGDDLGGFGGDKFPLLQPADVLAHRVLAHAHRLSNRLDAGPALVGPAILAPFQKTVDRQFSIVQSQLEQLVGQKETVSLAAVLQPPPPV